MNYVNWLWGSLDQVVSDHMKEVISRKHTAPGTQHSLHLGVWGCGWVWVWVWVWGCGGGGVGVRVGAGGVGWVRVGTPAGFTLEIREFTDAKLNRGNWPVRLLRYPAVRESPNIMTSEGISRNNIAHWHVGSSRNVLRQYANTTNNQCAPGMTSFSICIKLLATNTIPQSEVSTVYQTRFNECTRATQPHWPRPLVASDSWNPMNHSEL